MFLSFIKGLTLKQFLNLDLPTIQIKPLDKPDAMRSGSVSKVKRQYPKDKEMKLEVWADFETDRDNKVDLVCQSSTKLFDAPVFVKVVF